MAKKQFGLRLRPDQEEQIEEIIAADPETDRSKIIRRAIDEYLSKRRAARIAEEDGTYGTKKKTGAK